MLSIWKVLPGLSPATSFVLHCINEGIFSRFWQLFVLKCYKKTIIGLDEQTSLLSFMKCLENGGDFSFVS